MRDSTNDISRALRDRLTDNGSWRVNDGKAPRRWQPDASDLDLVRPTPISRGRVVLGGLVVLVLIGGAWAVLATTRPLASQVVESPAPNPVPTIALPELWLTPAVAPDTLLTINPRPTTAPTAVDVVPTDVPVLHVAAPVAPASRPVSGAVTQATERLGILTVEAQLTRPTAFNVEQQLQISARSGSAPLVGAHVSLRITNSFGSSEQAAPDTDRSGRSTKSWPTNRSVGLNQVRVLVSVGDGRELTAQLAFLGASSED